MRACPECLSVFATDPEFCSLDGTALLSGDDALAGKILAGHRIDALIGVGGTGCVFSGRRVSDGKSCAIKVLFGEMASDKSISARFEREAEAMKAISHRNVVSIWDYGTTERGLIYLVMGLLDGITLKDRIERDAPLQPDHAVRILEQLTAGLAEAHRQGFVHRDLKPGNVILEGPFGREQVKILDFGIVASLRDSNERERLTKTGYIIGTPTYMAPEQVDPSAVTPQVDVYALGVILYEMLTGEPPFTGTLEQILVAKITTEPKPIENGGDIGELVMSMLHMDPEERPPSALHVSAELSRLSLLTDDPATVRADMPELKSWSIHDQEDTAGVLVIDPTDENDIGDETHEDAREALDKWSSDTRRLDVDQGVAHIEFGEVSTRNQIEGRGDTVVDGPPSDEFDNLPAAGTPTNPEGDALEAETGEDDVAEIPTTITERPLVAPSEHDTLDTPEAMNEVVTSIDLIDNESDPSMPQPSVPRIDAVEEADTALDMRLDNLLSATPSVTVAPTNVIESSGEEASPADPVLPSTSGMHQTRRSPSFLIVGIVVAIAVGIAAAVALMASTTETVLVDVPVQTPNETP